MNEFERFVREAVRQALAHGHELPLTVNVTVQHLDGRVETFSDVIDEEYPE